MLFTLERLGNPQAAVWNTGKYGNLASASNATQWTVDTRMRVLPAKCLVYQCMSYSVGQLLWFCGAMFLKISAMCKTAVVKITVLLEIADPVLSNKIFISFSCGN